MVLKTVVNVVVAMVTATDRTEYRIGRAEIEFSESILLLRCGSCSRVVVVVLLWNTRDSTTTVIDQHPGQTH